MQTAERFWNQLYYTTGN